MARSYEALTIKRLVAALCALLMTMALLPLAAFAQPAHDADAPAQEAAQAAADETDADAPLSAQEVNIAQGSMGENCRWYLTTEGRLVIEPIDRTKPCVMGDIRYALHSIPVVGNPDSDAPWREVREQIVTVYIASGVKGSEMMDGLFYGCTNLTGADLTGLDTSNVKFARGMFDGCTSLVRFVMPNLNFNKVTNIEYMFYGCTALESLDLRYIDTSNATNMTRMFYGCSKLNSINLSGFKTKSATNMYEMFRGCSSLKTIDVSGFDTSNVTDMSKMFYNCESLSSLDLARFATPKLRTMSNMFTGCKSIKSIDLSGFEIGESVDRGYDLFYGCPALERVSFGSKWTFKGSSGKSTSLPTTQYGWISSLAGKTFTSSEIAEQRNNIADTYVKASSSANQLLIKTQGLVWSRGSLGGAVFQTNMPVGDSVVVKVDNKDVPRISYDLSSQTTIVTLKPDYLTALSDGNHKIELVSSAGIASASFRVSSDPSDVTLLEPVNMYRLYNPNSGEHHYTSDANERVTLTGLGWNDEGVGWVAPAVGDDVYRLYNPNAGEHHYTLDANERKELIAAGWNDEDVGWHSGGGVELQRQYNPNQYANNHNYTSDQNEISTLLGLGWKDEGVAWYGVR